VIGGQPFIERGGVSKLGDVPFDCHGAPLRRVSLPQH
jgi:hypothetical protein